VARTPRAGHERDFEKWLRRITSTASPEPGHIGSEVQPPGPEHPNEWVIVYQFSSQRELDGWLTSPVRSELLTEGAALTDGDARIQRLAMGTGDNPVTAVASFRVLQGHEEHFTRHYAEILDSLKTFEGHLRTQLFPPVEGVQEETVIVFSFESREELDIWLDSAERADILARMDTHLDGERQVNVVGGFGGWFELDQSAVKTWKQAVVVLAALYPTVLVLNEILGRLLPESTPYLLRVLVGLVAGVATLSWLLMPRLTARLSGWLRQ